jgi:fatty acid-binding protein DegV
LTDPATWNPGDIKPILTVHEGKLEVVSRQRTISKSIDKMFELMINACDGKAIERGAIIHADCPEKVQNLQNKINISFPELKPFLLSEFTPGLSLHTGPGTIGITILTRE